MDRRTFLFVLALSLALFGLNLYFEHQNTQKRQEWVKQQEAKKAQKNQQFAAELAQRTASPSSLPLSQIYADEEKQHFLTSGIQIQDQILTLSWSQDLPQQIFAQPADSDKTQAYSLKYHQPGLGAIALYSSDSQASLPVSRIPDFGRYDLQLVSFHPDDPSILVTLGEVIDGHFSVVQSTTPLQPTTTGANAPRYTAIALFQVDQNYLPVGFYNPHENKLVSIESLEELHFLTKVVNLPPSSTHQKTEERFYVLENDYQQLVFSNFGGALSEINLPFPSEENPHSVVKEIEFDRLMVEKHPYNALFPATPYYTPATTKDSLSFEKHDKGHLGGYYPLLRRDLIETGKWPSVYVKPQYYALNFVSEYPELANLVYEVKHFDSQSITFEASQQHRRITKTYRLGGTEDGPYCLILDVQIQGDSRGMWLTSGVPEVEWISGKSSPALKYRMTRNQKVEVNNIDLPKDAMTMSSVYPDWICNSNGFLGVILDPLTEIDAGFRVQTIPGSVVPSRLVEIDQEYELYKAADMPGYMALLPLKAQGGKMSFRLFAGPFSDDILNKVDLAYSNPETGYNPDYIACQTMHGWFTFISEPFAKFLLILMKFFHSITHSWALSIVLLTISLRVILYPLNAWSTRSMVKMQQIAPEVTLIQERHKKDPKKAQLEVMNLYRERGVNPASGCLPLLIQMPFLIGMFDLLKSSFALRGACFIPGWIDDLTAPDVLFRWKYPVFFFGTEFHLLPILLGIVMFVQQRFFSSAPTDPNQMTDQQRQQRSMGTIMAVVFAVMFYHFPSGLNIYWLSSMLLGILQQWFTTKQLQKKPVVLAPATKMSSKKAK